MKNPVRKQESEEFTDYMIRSSLSSMKTGMWTTLLLFVAFAIFNSILFPARDEQHFMMNFGIIMPFLLISLAVLYFKIFWKHIEIYLTVINLLVVGVILYGGLKAELDIPGYQYFYVWIMLIFMGTAAFYRIRYKWFVGVMLLMISSYIFVTVYNGLLKYDPFTFTNNLFFILAITSIGMIVAWNIYQLNRDNFKREKALEDNYNNLLRETRAKNRAEQSRDESQQQYLAILNTIPDSIFVLDNNLTILTANAEILRINQKYGLDTNVIGKRFLDIYPFPTEDITQTVDDVFTTGQTKITNYHVELGGKNFITEVRHIPMTTGNVVTRLMVIVRDVTREKSYEELKIKNAEQKELLLREIHHRVKNNLAIVISMLSLQVRANPNPELTGIIQDIELRIRSMALIHEHLYRSENLDRIPLAEYLKSLSAVIASTFQQPNVEFSSHLEPIDSDIEAALPIGLIANELLTNAFKYAFPDHRKGAITLSLKQLHPDQIEITVCDNGVGLPEHFSFEDQTTLGMFMVRLLVEQLYGKMEIVNKKGSTFRITFNHKLI